MGRKVILHAACLSILASVAQAVPNYLLLPIYPTGNASVVTAHCSNSLCPASSTGSLLYPTLSPSSRQGIFPSLSSNGTAAPCPSCPGGSAGTSPAGTGPVGTGPVTVTQPPLTITVTSRCPSCPPIAPGLPASNSTLVVTSKCPVCPSSTIATGVTGVSSALTVSTACPSCPPVIVVPGTPAPKAPVVSTSCPSTSAAAVTPAPPAVNTPFSFTRGVIHQYKNSTAVPGPSPLPLAAVIGTGQPSQPSGGLSVASSIPPSFVAALNGTIPFEASPPAQAIESALSAANQLVVAQSLSPEQKSAVFQAAISSAQAAVASAIQAGGSPPPGSSSPGSSSPGSPPPGSPAAGNASAGAVAVAGAGSPVTAGGNAASPVAGVSAPGNANVGAATPVVGAGGVPANANVGAAAPVAGAGGAPANANVGAATPVAGGSTPVSAEAGAVTPNAGVNTVSEASSSESPAGTTPASTIGPLAFKGAAAALLTPSMGMLLTSALGLVLLL